ncbi:MAG: hypothetical protein Q9202_006625 [Teloschistes flavicans]
MDNKCQCSFEFRDLLDHIAPTNVPVAIMAASHPGLSYRTSEVHGFERPDDVFQAQYQFAPPTRGPMTFFRYPLTRDDPSRVLINPPNEVRTRDTTADDHSIVAPQPVTNHLGGSILRWSSVEASGKELQDGSVSGTTQDLCDA